MNTTNIRNEVPIEYLRSLFEYIESVGVIIWKRRDGVNEVWNKRFAGKIAGSDIGGRLSVVINYKRYAVHRVVWAMSHGEWPCGNIDHIDGCALNNKMENLRVATKSQNGCNRGVQSNSKSGVKGVFFTRGAWVARIRINGKVKHLGSFPTIELAAKAYADAVPVYHGEFGRTS